jgi:hypothetical protein
VVLGSATWMVSPWWNATSPEATGLYSGGMPRASGPCSRSKPFAVKMFAKVYTAKRCEPGT